MVGHGGSSAGSYLADPTSHIPSHCASIVAASTLRVKWIDTGMSVFYKILCVLFQYVFITGGCASFPGFKERLEHELLAMRPFQSHFSVYRAQNPVMDAWYGAKQWAQEPALLQKYGITRRDYDEKGGEYLKEHMVTNCYFPTPVIPAKEEKS